MTATAARIDAGGGGSATGAPRHIAVIMDGNGRWAKKRFLPRVAGHRAGVEAVRRTVEAAPKLGIEVLTLYAFSTENWRRPESEVGDLMGLLKQYLLSEIDDLDRNGVRLRFIGDLTRLKPDLRDLLERGAVQTSGNESLTLVLALNYGAQDEVARAARRCVTDGVEITPEAIDARLDAADLPPPDLIVRPSGELRLSNFMLWQAAYAELLFTETLWPDFGEAQLREAVDAFAGRARRYGGL